MRRATPSLRRHGFPLIGLSALLGAQTAPVQARPAWASGTYVFADLCTMPENGERAGQRITLKRSPRGDGLVYEAASLLEPVRAGVVALDDTTKEIDFVAESESGTIHFHGTMTVDGLTGTFEDAAGTRPVRLPRVLRAHAHDVCRSEAAGSLDAGR